VKALKIDGELAASDPVDMGYYQTQKKRQLNVERRNLNLCLQFGRV
jgi:hypothetical protein